MGGASPEVMRARSSLPAVGRPAVGLAEGRGRRLRRVYRFDEDQLRFCAAFGIPRWLTDRLADTAPPAELERVLVTGRLLALDAGAAGFPEPRATGTLLADRAQIAELTQRLHRVAELSAP